MEEEEEEEEEEAKGDLITLEEKETPSRPPLKK